MASIAVLPVLIGLAVDYAIQFQARHDEGRRRGLDDREAAVSAATTGGPTIATAGLATAVGFLVLLLSPGAAGARLRRAPGAGRGAGAGLRRDRRLRRAGAPGAHRARPAVPARARPRAGRPGTGWPTPEPGRPWRWRWARVRLWGVEASERALAHAVHRPRRILAVGFVVAVLGLAVDTQSEVVSDVRELVPQDLQALQDVNTLQKESGVAGEIDVVVRAKDITDPAVVAWMTKFQDRTLKAGGYKTGDSCSQAKRPARPVPGPVAAGPVPHGRHQERRGHARAAGLGAGLLLAGRDHARPDAPPTWPSACGCSRWPTRRRSSSRSRTAWTRPPGVSADVVGLPALAAEANSQLSSPLRRAFTLLAALAAVFFVLFAFRRSAREAAVPLIPIALATGWAAGLMFLLGLLPGPLSVKLNPMSVTLGALVIAISTEFSVLLSARYRQEREAGSPPARAIELTYRSTGAAVMASGVTAIAGFAALIASDIRMLRDFGILTVVDLGVSLAGVMLVLPAALVWAEQHGEFTLRDLNPRPLLAELGSAARDAGSRLARRGAPG